MASSSGISPGGLIPGKKLIVCCDGTWKDSDNGFEKDNSWWPWSTGHLATPSNVTRIARATRRYHTNKKSQIVYYQAGVGTGGNLWDQVAGGASGEGLSEHIREAYAFLANNYQEPDDEHEGDEIYLIGFSRGAFTARSIAGLIGEVGILTKRGMSNFYQVFKDYETLHEKGWEEKYMANWEDSRPEDRPFGDTAIYIKDPLYGKALESKKLTRIKGVSIDAVAVWDTVGSLGIPKVAWLPGTSKANKEYSFHDTSLSPVIKNAFQALALDEKRPPFSPAVWERPDGVNTNLIQVWFPGVHSNVGGGNDDQGIADITLAWMMSQLETMITFDTTYTEFLYKQTQEWETQHLKKPREWSLGYIQNSSTGLMAFAGGETRTPGRYTRIDPQTLRPNNQPLQNTNEFIHASARVRLGLRGAPGIDDHVPYWCAALDGWSIRGVDVDGDGVVDDVAGRGIEWVFAGGRGKGGASRDERVLREAPLGQVEMRLLGHFGDIATKVLKVVPDGSWVLGEGAKGKK